MRSIIFAGLKRFYYKNYKKPILKPNFYIHVPVLFSKKRFFRTFVLCIFISWNSSIALMSFEPDIYPEDHPLNEKPDPGFEYQEEEEEE